MHWSKLIQNHADTFLAIIIFITLATIIGFSSSVFGGADTYQHYMIARASWGHPELLLDHWGKPVFTLLSSPFAQFGLYGVQLMNCLILVLTGWYCSRILKHWKVRGHTFVLLVLFAIPAFLLASFSALTEPLFSLVLIAGIFLLTREKYILSAVLLSFIPMVRNEGVLFLPLFAVALAMLRQWKSIPFLVTGFLLYSIIGGFFLEEGFFWLIKGNPYDKQTLYGSGDWNYYLYKLPEYVGVVFLIGSIAGYLLLTRKTLFRDKDLKQTVSFLLFSACGIGYFVLHAYAYWRGDVGAFGLERIMIPFFPFMAISLVVLTTIFGSQKVWLHWFVLLVIAIGFFQNKPWVRIPFERDFEEEGIYLAAETIKSVNVSNETVYAYDPRVWYYLDLDMFNNEEARFADRSTKQIDAGSFFVWDSHFGPNEGGTEFTSLLFHPDLKLVDEFMPDSNAVVYSGHTYKTSLFKSVGKERNRWTVEHIATDFGAGKLEKVNIPSPERIVTGEQGTIYLMGMENPFFELVNTVLPDTVDYCYLSGTVSAQVNQVPDLEKSLLVFTVEEDNIVKEYHTLPLVNETAKWDKVFADHFVNNEQGVETRIKLYVWYFGETEISVKQADVWLSIFPVLPN